MTALNHPLAAPPCEPGGIPSQLVLASLIWGGALLSTPALGGTADCCAEPTDTGSCSSQECTDAVCEIDPYCCDTAWDEVCVTEAEWMPACPTTCDGLPTGEPPLWDEAVPVACDFASTDAWCSDPTCATAVCDLDPYCCETDWDGICEYEAEQFAVCDSQSRYFDFRIDSRTQGATTDGRIPIWVPGAETLTLHIFTEGFVDLVDEAGELITVLPEGSNDVVVQQGAVFVVAKDPSYFVLDGVTSHRKASGTFEPFLEAHEMLLKTHEADGTGLLIRSAHHVRALQVSYTLQVFNPIGGAELVITDNIGSSQRFSKAAYLETQPFFGSDVVVTCMRDGAPVELTQCPAGFMDSTVVGGRYDLSPMMVQEWFYELQIAYQSGDRELYHHRLDWITRTLPLLETDELHQLTNELGLHITALGAEGLELLVLKLADHYGSLVETDLKPMMAVRVAFIDWHDNRACGRHRADISFVLTDGLTIGGVNIRPIARMAMGRITTEERLAAFRMLPFVQSTIATLEDAGWSGATSVGRLLPKDDRCGSAGQSQPVLYYEPSLLSQRIIGPELRAPADYLELTRRHSFVLGDEEDSCESNESTLAGLQDQTDALRPEGSGAEFDALTDCLDVALNVAEGNLCGVAFDLDLQDALRDCFEDTCTPDGEMAVDFGIRTELSPHGGDLVGQLCNDSEGPSISTGDGNDCGGETFGYGTSETAHESLCQPDYSNPYNFGTRPTQDVLQLAMCLEAIRRQVEDEYFDPLADDVQCYGQWASCFFAAGVAVVGENPFAALIAGAACLNGIDCQERADYHDDHRPPGMPGPEDLAELLDEDGVGHPGHWTEPGVLCEDAEIEIDGVVVSLEVCHWRESWSESPADGDGHGTRDVILIKESDADNQTRTVDRIYPDGTRDLIEIEDRGNGQFTMRVSRTVDNGDGTETTTTTTYECTYLDGIAACDEGETQVVDRDIPEDDGTERPSSEDGSLLPEECAFWLVDDAIARTYEGQGGAIDPLPPEIAPLVTICQEAIDAMFSTEVDTECDETLVDCAAESECCCASSPPVGDGNTCPDSGEGVRCEEGTRWNTHSCSCEPIGGVLGPEEPVGPTPDPVD